MRDVLSDIFDTIRLRATLYFRADYSPPWAVTAPACEPTARPVLRRLRGPEIRRPKVRAAI